MQENVEQTSRGRTPEGRFGKQETVTPLIWAKLELERPEVIELYSSIPLSLLVERKMDEQGVVARRRTGLVSLLRRRYGLDMPPERMVDMAVSLGLSTTGIHVITEATLRCISEDTGIILPYNKGSAVQNEARRVKRVVQDYKKLKEYLSIPKYVPPFERAVIERYLEGNAPSAIASDLNHEMELAPAISDSQTAVLQILDRVLGKVDYVHPSRLTQRSLKARELIEAASRGDYVNRKAQVTEEILEMLAWGNTREEILAELSIAKHQYQALVGEAFSELESDPEGNQELNNIYAEVTKGVGKVEPMKPRTRNQAARRLLDPYRSFRQRLGESVTESNRLTTRLLSTRERTILERASQGVKQKELSLIFLTNPGYITEAVYWLLGETKFHTFSERLQERQRLFHMLNDDLQSSAAIPASLLMVNGVPTIEILAKLASGKKFSDISKEIEDSTGKHISEGRLIVHYQKIRGYYKIPGNQEGPASLK